MENKKQYIEIDLSDLTEDVIEKVNNVINYEDNKIINENEIEKLYLKLYKKNNNVKAIKNSYLKIIFGCISIYDIRFYLDLGKHIIAISYRNNHKNPNYKKLILDETFINLLNKVNIRHNVITILEHTGIEDEIIDNFRLKPIKKNANKI